MNSIVEMVGAIVSEAVSKPKRIVRKWDVSDEETLWQLAFEQGKKLDEIHALNIFPGRTLYAIRGKLHEMDYGDPAKKESALNADFLTIKVRRKLKVFLRGRGRKMAGRETVRIFAEEFGMHVTLGHIRYYRRKLGFRLTHREATASTYYREARLKHIDSLQAGLRKYHAEFRGKVAAELDALYKKRKNEGYTEKKKACRTCGKLFFATREFFLLGKFLKETGVQRLYSYCRGCGLPWDNNKLKG